MNDQKISDIIKGAAEINLRYSASLLNLSKEYLSEFTKVVRDREENTEADDSEVKTATGTEKNTVPAQSTQNPGLLLLAGRKGEIANAAFAVNNTSQMSGSVSLQLKGDFANCHVTTEPENLTLKNGEGCIIRIIAKIGSKMPVDADHTGSVVIPELGLTIADFIIRRLPDLAPRKKTARKKPSDRKT